MYCLHEYGMYWCITQINDVLQLCQIQGALIIPAQRPVTRSFDVYFDLRPNKRLSKQ